MEIHTVRQLNKQTEIKVNRETKIQADRQPEIYTQTNRRTHRNRYRYILRNINIETDKQILHYSS